MTPDSLAYGLEDPWMYSSHRFLAGPDPLSIFREARFSPRSSVPISVNVPRVATPAHPHVPTRLQSSMISRTASNITISTPVFSGAATAAYAQLVC